MAIRRARYSKEEFARRGSAIYEETVRPGLGPKEHGKIVAIDIESKTFELADNTLEAANRLLARLPDAQIWFERVGQRGVHRFGPRATESRG